MMMSHASQELELVFHLSDFFFKVAVTGHTCIHAYVKLGLSHKWNKTWQYPLGPPFRPAGVNCLGSFVIMNHNFF